MKPPARRSLQQLAALGILCVFTGSLLHAGSSTWLAGGQRQEVKPRLLLEGVATEPQVASDALASHPEERDQPGGATDRRQGQLKNHSQTAPDDQEGGGTVEVLESSFECKEEREFDKVCLYRNAYLWQGRVVLVFKDANRTVPRVPMDFRWGSGYTWMQPLVMTPEQLTSARDSANATISWTGPRDEVYLWSGAVHNYGHFTGEYVPTVHQVLCKYLGRCTADNTTGMHLLLWRPTAHTWPGFVDQALECLADGRLRNVLTPEMMGTLIAARRLLVGVGPNCRAANFCQNRAKHKNKKPLLPRYYRMYRDHMAACLGFDPEAVAPLTPKIKIVIIDRQYSIGRHMLNVAELAEGLRARHGAIADVEVRYMETATLAQQAQLWSTASLVIHVHGGTLGNYAFLPHKAVALQIGIERLGRVFPQHFELDLQKVTDISTLLLELPISPYAQTRSRMLEMKDPFWKGLTAEQKVDIMERGTCDSLPKDHPARTNGCWIQYVLRGHDLILPLDAVFNITAQAVELLFKKQGRPAPAEALGVG